VAGGWSSVAALVLDVLAGAEATTRAYTETNAP